MVESFAYQSLINQTQPRLKPCFSQQITNARYFKNHSRIVQRAEITKKPKINSFRKNAYFE